MQEREQWADAEALRAGYERLRAAVLSGEAGGWRLGHGMLSARGTVAWISAFGDLAPPAPAGTDAASPAPPPWELLGAEQPTGVAARRRSGRRGARADDARDRRLTDMSTSSTKETR